MSYTVLKNFSCNGIKKKKGQSLSDDEAKKMGEGFAKLKSDDFFQSEAPAKPEYKEKPKKDKKPKK